MHKNSTLQATNHVLMHALLLFVTKADNGNRTRLSSLGSWRSTDELHLHHMGVLYAQ